jgi:D-arabinose 1-dehydrogenase-like Zn-dependent alcohol dehydrogenase
MDAIEFLDLAAKLSLQMNVTTYELKDANSALDDLRQGKFHGAAVISFDSADAQPNCFESDNKRDKIWLY